MKPKSHLEVPSELVDEIVEEILAETPKLNPKPEEEDFVDGGDLEISKLRLRIQNLENRIERHTHDYKTTAIEAERQISEKASEVEHQYEQQLMYLQSQIEALRTAMIRLSNEFKKFKESISLQK